MHDHTKKPARPTRRKSVAGRSVTPKGTSRAVRSRAVSAGRSSAQSHADARANPVGPALTRRQLLVGGAGIAVAALVGGGAYALTSAASGGGSSAQAAEGALSIPQDAVFTTEQCEYVDDLKGLLTLRTRASLPFGTTLTSCSESLAVCLVPTKSADPLLQVGLLHLGSGNMTTALKASVGAEEGFQIFDARANGAGLVWLESNVLSGDWRVYSTTLDGAAVGEPILAAEGNGSWTLPSLAVSGGFAWWQTTPKEDGAPPLSCKNGEGEEVSQPALCRIAFGGTQDSAQASVTSPGGFACAPVPALGGIACAQKQSEKSKTWQLIFVSEEDGQITDQLTLPSTMKPMDVSYGPNGFGFSFDALYEFGDGMANLGTYVPAEEISLTTATATADALAALEQQLSSGQKSNGPTDEDRAKAKAQGEDAVCELYSSAPWFRFPRAPITSPAFAGNWLFVKSTNVIAAVDLVEQKYVTIPTESATQGYGEYLATSGTSDRIVTFANVDYTPMSGERINECTVRVWEPV